MYTLIENFCLGIRRLEVFGKRSSLRRGWVTLFAPGQEDNIPSDGQIHVDGEGEGDAGVAPTVASRWVQETWEEGVKELAAGGKPVVPVTAEIDSLRPKSPVRQGQGGNTHNASNSMGGGGPNASVGIMNMGGINAPAPRFAAGNFGLGRGSGAGFANGGPMNNNNPMLANQMMMAQPMMGMGMPNAHAHQMASMGMGNMDEMMGNWNPMMGGMGVGGMNPMGTGMGTAGGGGGISGGVGVGMGAGGMGGNRGMSNNLVAGGMGGTSGGVGIGNMGMSGNVGGMGSMGPMHMMGQMMGNGFQNAQGAGGHGGFANGMPMFNGGMNNAGWGDQGQYGGMEGGWEEGGPGMQGMNMNMMNGMNMGNMGGMGMGQQQWGGPNNF